MKQGMAYEYNDKLYYTEEKATQAKISDDIIRNAKELNKLLLESRYPNSRGYTLLNEATFIIDNKKIIKDFLNYII